jgi:hypothetical protein
VFTRWKDAENSVKGYSGAVHKRFRSESAAEQWLRSKGVYAGNDDASDISTDDFGSGTIYGGSGASWAPSVRPIPPQRPSAIIDVKHIGPDSSVGKPNEIYGTSIQVEPEILKILCPKGVTATTRRELMEVTPDVLALPGKLGSTSADTAEVWDQFAGAAVNEIAEQRASYSWWDATPRYPVEGRRTQRYGQDQDP